MKLVLIGKKTEAADATSFIFKSEITTPWQAGQFLHYTLPHDNPDDRKDERYFTISAAPFEKNIMLTTRFAEKGSSFKRALSALPLGGTIEASGPEGDFVITDSGTELIFIAGGIGITPYRAILLDLDRRGVSINAKLLYANRDSSFIYKEELGALTAKHKNFTIRYFVSPERIDEIVIRKEVADLTRPTFYVSGPEAMVESFEKMLLGMGVPDGNLKRDYFPGYNWP